MSSKKHKLTRKMNKINGIPDQKKISMSHDTKLKFDLHNRVIEDWQLVRNVMQAALKSEIKDETLKGSIKTVEGLAATILMGVNKDLDFWFDQELEKQGFGRNSGYIPVGIDQNNSMITLVKAPQPPMPDEKMVAVLEEAQKKGCVVCQKPEIVTVVDGMGYCAGHKPEKGGKVNVEVPKENTETPNPAS